MANEMYKEFRKRTGFKQWVLADILGLSQVKISREEKKIMDFLRSELVV
jgi:DNA-directed RNA polymerase specialized sigma subunit